MQSLCLTTGQSNVIQSQFGKRQHNTLSQDCEDVIVGCVAKSANILNVIHVCTKSKLAKVTQKDMLFEKHSVASYFSLICACIACIKLQESDRTLKDPLSDAWKPNAAAWGATC